MSSTIKIKRSEVSGNPSVLGAGELAYSALADNGSNGGDRLYVGMGTETLGNAVNHVVIGGKFFTDAISNSTSLNTSSTLVKRDGSGNFSAGSITASLIGNADTTTKLATGRTISITGDIDYTSPSFDGSGNVTAAGTLATVNSNVGSFGSTTAIPVITVNAKGLVTGVTTASISTSFNLYGDSGVTAVAGGDSLSVYGGVGVTTSSSAGPSLTIDIGQDVATTANVRFNDVNVDGTLYSNDITATSLTLDGDATITGNLTVQGTTTTINSTSLSVTDLNITVAKDAVDATAANGAGLTVAGPAVPPTLLYASVDDSWNFNKVVNAPSGIVAALTGNASTATTLETARTIAITGDIAYTSPSFNGSGNVTAAATLATVNSNVGSYGSSTSVSTFTVNAKGLITAAGSSAIPTASTSVIGLASFDSTNFSVTAGAVSIAVIDGGTY